MRGEYFLVFCKDPLRGNESIQVGVIEPAFDADGFTDAAELPDGSILLSGQFIEYNGHYSPGLVKISAAGIVDTGFSVGDGAQFDFPADRPARVDSITVDGSGGVFLTGNFDIFNTTFAGGLVKLFSAGIVDTHFAPTVRFADFVSSPPQSDLILNPDGSALVTGQFRHEGDPWPFALTQLVGTGTVSVQFDAGGGEVPEGFQWRVNGGPWQDNGAVVHGVPIGDATIEYRPVPGYAVLPPDNVQVAFGGEIFLNPAIQALAGTFGARDQDFVSPEFKRESAPTRVITDGNGGLLLTWANFHNVNERRTGALIRVHESDGSLDETFNFGPQLRFTLTSAVQADGLILVSGGSGSPLADGSQVNQILRVFPDGSRDHSFQSPIFNDGILMVTAQPDGKVLAGGTFTAVNGFPVSGLVRLNDDGSLDEGFLIPELTVHPDTFFQNGIWAPIILDEFGNRYIGGSFGTVNGEPREEVARLFPDGSLDLNYGAGGFFMAGGRPVRGIGFQSDGGLVLGGRFEDDFGTEAVLVRLDPDGVFDPTFNLVSRDASGLFRQVRMLEVMTDNRIVAAGGTIARFNSDGRL